MKLPSIFEAFMYNNYNQWITDITLNQLERWTNHDIDYLKSINFDWDKLTNQEKNIIRNEEILGIIKDTNLGGN